VYNFKEYRMPTVLRVAGYRFFFYSNEGSEPPHIHVQKAEKYASSGFSPFSLSIRPIAQAGSYARYRKSLRSI
jgi:hypothetical protein